jgi:uncharacterized protein YidB (DUF937 family)
MLGQLVRETADRFGLSTASVSALASSLLSQITNEGTGGPEGFVDQFQRAGLGEVVRSWFGGQAARTITPAQLESALGTDALDKLAGSAGLTRPVATNALTFLLPKLVGALTPNGTFPSRSALRSQLSS